MEPFLKWAGGKRWFVSSYNHLFETEYNRYLEPFLGSGAVFFHLTPNNAILSDSNIALIDTYNAIKDDWYRVYSELRKHQRKHSKEYYYEIRSKRMRNIYTKAAQFIYLNRTCWNGLYRVNLKGEFNVPKGTKEKVIFDTDNFEYVATLLNNAEIISRDFENIIDEARENDLLFVDPPYTVNHDKNGFLKYNESIFSWDDQVRLSECLKQAKERGVQIILTNANHISIRRLYRSDFNIKTIPRVSTLAGISKYRGKVKELLVSSNLI